MLWLTARGLLTSEIAQFMTTLAALPTEVETKILPPEATRFLHRLAHEFEPRRQELLAARVARQQRIDAGEFPDFISDTSGIRKGEWRVAPIPRDLQDRRVEITGPVD